MTLWTQTLDEVITTHPLYGLTAKGPLPAILGILGGFGLSMRYEAPLPGILIGLLLILMPWLVTRFIDRRRIRFAIAPGQATRFQGEIEQALSFGTSVDYTLTRGPIRKALNLGHTFGHAFESWALKRKPILHGYAVAFGLIPELYLSVAKTGFPTEKMRQTVNFIKEFYGTLDITCDDYDEIIELMHHDKKNQNGIINFTMLGGIGDIRINQTATTEEIKEALDFFREG